MIICLEKIDHKMILNSIINAKKIVKFLLRTSISKLLIFIGRVSFPVDNMTIRASRVVLFSRGTDLQNIFNTHGLTQEGAVVTLSITNGKGGEGSSGTPFRRAFSPVFNSTLVFIF